MRKAPQTQGYKAVLVSDEAFEILKSYQRREDQDTLALSFDLKEIVTAVVLEAAQTIPDLRERARMRALTVMHDIVTTQNQQE